MKKKITLALILGSLLCSIVACGDTNTNETIQNSQSDVTGTEQNQDLLQGAYSRMEAVNIQEENRLDDKYRNYYEIFPYSFCDSNGDGIGDINGITSKLNYIAELGITGIWLTPICKSTTYHKYDVIDYYEIDSQFGTMEDFENFLKECDARGIDVILDLVVNHTSSHNDWFIQARDYVKTLSETETPSEDECPYVSYYNFSREYASGWTQIGDTGWYYESQFWSEMPDLNLDSEAVRQEIENIVQFWLEKGIAGFRLDATTSYYTAHADQNIEFLAWLNQMVKEKKEDAYLVGECWESSVSYASYYESGIDSFFNFDFADNNGKIAKLFKGSSASTFGNSIVSIAQANRDNNPDYIDAAFTSNHDMGRSAGFYAGDFAESMTKMAQAVTMFMGGNYFLYYGDELGMKGTGDDENKRTPMLWSMDTQAGGMCKSLATKEIDNKYQSLEEQIENENSIYYYVKEGLKLRNTFPEIARGTTSVVEAISTDSVLALKKEYEGRELLILMNFSENPSEVDLTEITLNGDEPKVCGTLLTGDEDVLYQEHQVTMPAYSIELFQ